MDTEVILSARVNDEDGWVSIAFELSGVSSTETRCGLRTTSSRYRSYHTEQPMFITEYCASGLATQRMIIGT